MCLRFVFLLITRVVAWLRLSRREQAWQTAEILILRHQLAVLQRRQPRRPNVNWADRALFATLLGVIPRARRLGAAAAGHPGHDPALAPRHRPPPLGRQVHAR
jgi:putative transposase